jgi:transposase
MNTGDCFCTCKANDDSLANLFRLNSIHTSLRIKAKAVTPCQSSQFPVIKMPRLSAADRERAIGQIQAGNRPAQVAAAFGVAVSTICRLWTRFHANGNTHDFPRSGRPRVTNARQDRAIHRRHLREPFTPATETATITIGRHGAAISGQTVRRRLRENALHCHRPARRPILTARHRQQRLLWAQQHRNWNWRQWRNILFTDESRYCLHHPDGRIRVWRRRNQRYADNNVQETNAWGGPSIMVWGGIRLNHLVGPVVFQDIGPGRGNGVNAQRYIDQVLRPVVVPHFQQHANLTLQQDNARPHTARVTTHFLQQHGITVMQWPALSPDLNPIEHFWDHLQRQLNVAQPRPANARQLQQTLRQIWNNVPMATINRLIHSMRARCQAVINAQGGHTNY